MADYDFSKPAPDRSHRIPNSAGSGIGGMGLIAAGALIVLAVLYAIFAGADTAPAQDAGGAAPQAQTAAPAATQ